MHAEKNKKKQEMWRTINVRIEEAEEEEEACMRGKKNSGDVVDY